MKRTLLQTIAMLFGSMAGGGHAAEPAKAPGSAQELARMKEVLGQPPRIPARTDLTEEERAFATPPRGMGVQGDVPQMYGILLNHPELTYKFLPMSGFFLRGSELTPRDRELAILRNAWLMQAPLEWGEHVAIGKKAGISDAEIEALMTGSSAAGWNEHDRAVVKATEELHDHAMISDATWAQLAQGMTNAQLIELPIMVGQYKAIAYLQNSLRMEIRPSNPGLAAR